MSPIPLFDYLAQYAELKTNVMAAVRRVLESGRLILGPELAAFEVEFAATLGVGHAVGVNSGTDAIQIALRALGIGPGDDVLTVANTAVPTVSAICAAGATPIFCDADPDTALMTASSVAACLTPRTRAVVAVHLYGNAADIPAIRAAVGGRKIAVIEDCAQAHGATLNGIPVGTLGDIGAFSFYPTKNLGAYGDAGLCFTRSPELAQAMRMIRQYGFDGQYYSEREGLNSRLDELQAAILRVKLPRLPGWVERRRALAQCYLAALPGDARPVRPAPGANHAYHLFVVTVPNRDQVREHLMKAGIGCGIHYPFPIHLMRGFAPLGGFVGQLPHTERLATQVLSLPMYPELGEADVARVCAALGDVLAQTRQGPAR